MHKMKGQDACTLKAFPAPGSMAMFSVKGQQATALYSTGVLAQLIIFWCVISTNE